MSRKKIRNLARKPVTPIAQVIPQTNPLPKGCFLSTENEPQFRLLLGEYIATYNPQHRDEYDLVTEAVYCKWRQQRYWLAESAQIEVAIARNEATFQKDVPRADAAAHLANGIAQSQDLMRFYVRYQNQLHRQYLRCLKELRDLQATRQPSPSSPNDSPKEANSEIEHFPVSPGEVISMPITPKSHSLTPNPPSGGGHPSRGTDRKSLCER